MNTHEPPPDVLRAFGVEGGPAVLLPGGEGRSWHVADLVLKPGSVEREVAWEATHLAPLGGVAFRLAGPVGSAWGGWVVDGWSARRFLDGTEEPSGRWTDKVDICRAFHAAVAGLSAPGWLDSRTSRWATADRVAFGEEDMVVEPTIGRLVEDIRGRLRPVESPSQLVHGDISGNVLFDEGQPPAIIDLSLYWRPATFGLAVLVVDAIAWGGASASLLGSVRSDREIDQMLLRALLFRILASTASVADVDAYGRTLDVILARTPGSDTT